MIGLHEIDQNFHFICKATFTSFNTIIKIFEFSMGEITTFGWWFDSIYKIISSDISKQSVVVDTVTLSTYHRVKDKQNNEDNHSCKM